MLINCTNHAFETWSDSQKGAASTYGYVYDVAFPLINPQATEEERVEQAITLGEELLKLNPNAVLCQGEMGVMFTLVDFLKRHHIKVIYACSKREVVEQMQSDGSTIKQSRFVFSSFREYQFSC